MPFLTVTSSAPLYSQASETQLDGLQAVPGPAGRHALLTGTAPINRDTAHAVTSRLPIVLAVIAAITFVLMFLMTGSVVLPLKTLVLNGLSMTATFGALVWIFQDGHLGALGTTATGTLVVTMPALLFCIAFGLSMDYEVFLVSRIHEYWLASNRTPADNDESVALGVAHTGRVITAAALIMSISFAAMIAAQVSFMRMFGARFDAGQCWETQRWCACCSFRRSCVSWAGSTGGHPNRLRGCTSGSRSANPRHQPARGCPLRLSSDCLRRRMDADHPAAPVLR